MTKNNIDQSKLLSLILMGTDALMVVIAFLVSYFLRDKGIFRLFLDQIQPIGVYLTALPFAIVLMIVVISFFHLYEPRQRVTTFTESYAAFQAVTLWILLIMAGSYVRKMDYSRIIVLELYVFSAVFIVLGRVFVRNLQSRILKNGFGMINIIVVGTGRPAKEIARRLDKYRLVAFNLVGFVGDNSRLGSLNNLYKVIKKHNISEVYISDPSLSYEKILDLVARCPDKKVRFKITSNIFELFTGSVDIANLETIPSLDLGKVHFSWWKRFYKSVFDFLISLVILLISLPLWICIAIAITIDSKGKILLSQKRVGLNGKLFYMYKFRTMKQETPLYEAAPSGKNDSRVTKVGKILRRTSLDELPQLLNIIKGDMSIVGPRPEMPFVVKTYSQWQKRRLMVKPGLTGLWQILGRKDLPLHENLEYDFYYINNQSLLLDIVIILKTIPLVILGKGAY